MKIEDFEWDDKNVEHIALHNVLPEEAEEIFIDEPLYSKTSEGKYLALGQTLDGRYLFVVFVFKDLYTVRPITARNMNLREVRGYRKWLKK
ncbi:MAG: BrnT family toxin [Thermodesulfobacteriota bacterium]|nr:BrnT family toxin [Thermodesulfobacteriota bacterium]